MKRLWKRFVRWFNRVFRGIEVTIKPTGTVSRLTGVGSGIEPLFKPYYRDIE